MADTTDPKAPEKPAGPDLAQDAAELDTKLEAAEDKGAELADSGVDEATKVVSEADEDIARASNALLNKLQGAKGEIDALRQKGHTLEGWITEAEQWVTHMIGKAKGVLSGKGAGA